MLSISFILISLLAAALADNDWSKPCFSGVCQYDLPATNGSASGTLKIWGPATVISDITPAAGWDILDCSSGALKQDIRLVCSGNSTDCAHLYSGTGNSKNAVGKLVRLPETCGKSAFAVVTNAYVSQDQSMPSSLSRRDGKKPTVQGLSINTNFASADTPASGPVNFAIRAANVPGANGDLSINPQQQRRSNSRIFGRGAVSDFVTGAVNDISSLNDFNVDKSTTLTPVDVDKTFNLFDKSISCPPVDASVKVDADTKAHAVASIGVAATGTILPPEVTSFSLIAGLNADLDGSIDLQATASGTLDSGKIQLFEVGIPGLDFPGVLTIGPSFVINGQATATLDLDVGLTVGISYTIDNAQLTFPPNGQKSSGAFNIGDTPLKLTVSATGKATGTVEAHLIPTLNFGISALDDTVSANVFLELDASATMSLTVEAEANASATVNARSESMPEARSRRGYFLLSPESLNIRAPQFDDSQGDGEDDAEDEDDSTSINDSDDTPGDDDGVAHDTNDNDTGGNADNDTATEDSSNANDTNGSDSVDDNGDSNTDDLNTGGFSDPSGANADANDDSNAEDASNIGNDSEVDDADPDGTSGDETGDLPDDNGSDASFPTDDTASPSPSSDDDTPASTTSTDALTSDPATTPPESRVALANPSTTTSVGGCFDIEAALDVSAGADGSFFGLFDKSTKVDLFNKKFEILKKCFGSGANAARRDLTSISALRSRSASRFFFPRSSSLVKARGSGLTCSPAGDAQQQDVADQTIAASSIKQL